MQLRNVKRKILIGEIEEIKDTFFNTKKPDVNMYVKNFPDDFRFWSLRYLENWITRFKLTRKMVAKLKVTDIWNFF